MVHPAEGEHLRSVLGGAHVTDRLTFVHHGRRLVTHVSIGVDLHFHTAVREYSFGHHRDRVDPLVLGRDDERSRLVIGIRGASARSNEARRNDRSRCLSGERHDGVSTLDGSLENNDRIHASEDTVDVAVPIARTGLTRLDETADGACLAANFSLSRLIEVVNRGHVLDGHDTTSLIAVRTRSGVAGNAVTRPPVASRIALMMAGAVGMRVCSPTPLMP